MSNEEIVPGPPLRYIIQSNDSSFFYLSTYDHQSRTLVDPAYQDSRNGSFWNGNIFLKGERIYFQTNDRIVKILDERTLVPIKTIQIPQGEIHDVVANKLIVATSHTLMYNFAPIPTFYLTLVNLDDVNQLENILSGGRFDGYVSKAIGWKQKVAFVRGNLQNVIRIVKSTPPYENYDINAPEGSGGVRSLLLDNEENLLAISASTVVMINQSDYSKRKSIEYLPSGYHLLNICIDQGSNKIYAVAYHPDKSLSEIISCNLYTGKMLKIEIRSQPEFSFISCVSFDPSAKLILIGSHVYESSGNQGLITMIDLNGNIVHQFPITHPPSKIMVTAN